MKQAVFPITEFGGLRSKMYSIKVGSEEKKRAKGVKKVVVKKVLKHEHFKSVYYLKETARKRRDENDSER